MSGFFVMFDVKSLILNQLPEGVIGDLAKSIGSDNDTVEKVIGEGIPEIVKEGQKTEGGLFDNLQNTVISKTVASKTGVDEGLVSSIIEKVLPLLKEYIDGKELMKIIGGLSDGFDMDDVQNIAGAIFNNDDKKSSSKQEKSGGFLGNILGGLFGGKK